jgi:tetratricopeptide (TPR) repeat protein
MSLRKPRAEVAQRAGGANLYLVCDRGSGVFRVCVALAAALWAGVGWAADQPQYAPPPDWVKAVPIPAAKAAPPGAAIQVLLFDSQTRFGLEDDESYSETAFRILTPVGLSLLNAISPSWNPETETLTFNRLNVLRDGQVIDLLQAGKKVTVLRREKNLELAMLDGDLTATVQPEGLQVGDVVDMAITLQRRDPTMRGNSQAFSALPALGVVGRVFLRAIWPSAKPVRWRATEGLPAPVVSAAPAGTDLVVDATDFTAPKPPEGAPARYRDIAQLEFSQFRDWAAVSALMAPLYAKAETLGPTSALKAEAQKIRASFATPTDRAAAALRLVQDQLRYTFVGLNLGGMVPADADVTWARRFGDCKGKSVVLVALLRELGIEAEPVLVTTSMGDGLDQRLPMLVFDHVIVHARIGGKDFWLDGTRSGDRGLEDIATPDFHWVLPIRAAGASLVNLTPSPFAKPTFESLLRVDASAGLDAPAATHAENVYRGDSAVTWNQALTSLGRDEADRSLRGYWRGRLPWVDIKAVAFAFDDAHRVLTMTMDGAGAMEWTNQSGIRDFDIGDSSLGFSPSFKRDAGLHDDAPYTVDFPSYDQRTVEITLPGEGAGFGLMNAGDADQTVAGVRYQRQARIVGGVVTMTASTQSLAPEFPAAEASADAVALRHLNDFNVDVRFAPQATAATSEPADEDQVPPSDASGYDVRAAGYLQRHDFKRAIADLDQAMKLDPASSKYVYNRGVAYFESHQDDLALADFGQALRLNPSDELALEARAQIYLFRRNTAQAKADFAAAARISGSDSKVLVREALAYDRAGLYDAEIGLYDQLIAKTPTAWLYNARCWARGQSGHDLPAALADCDASLKLKPDAAATFDSRGLVDMRLGRLDDAIRDYDAALALAPKQAPSLYGRGVAKLRKGDKQAGQADIDAAKTISANVGETFARLGLAPS